MRLGRLAFLATRFGVISNWGAIWPVSWGSAQIVVSLFTHKPPIRGMKAPSVALLFSSGFIKYVTPSARGCEECLKTGSWWVHLRICRSCGYVGCCDHSPGKYATAHFQVSGRPIIEGYDPPEGWGRCYVDETFIELDHPTQQLGPIPRFAR